MKSSSRKTLKPETITALQPCMEYLHGDVADNELEAACYYEYARESEVLREAARLNRENGSNREQNYLTVENKFECGAWFIQHPWGFIWECPSFPAKSWNQLDPRERNDIVPAFSFPAHVVQPLQMNEAWMLDAMGVFDELKAIAAAATAERRKNLSVKARPKVNGIVEGWPPSVSSLEQKLKRLQRLGAENQSRTDVAELRSKLKRQIKQREGYSWIHAVFTIDFAKGETRLKDEFVAWLKLNRARIDRCKRPSGRTDYFKDRLKALAAWRLYVGHAGDWDKAVQFADEHRKKFKHAEKSGGISYKKDDGRPFHNPGGAQGKKTPPNEVPLFGDQAAYLKAIRRAKGYRAELIPWEFGEFANP